MKYEDGKKGILSIGKTKKKTVERIKEHKINIKLGKSTTATAKTNNKSIIVIDFNNIENVVNYINSNYAFLREAMEINSDEEFVSNDMFLSKFSDTPLKKSQR